MMGRIAMLLLVLAGASACGDFDTAYFLRGLAERQQAQPVVVVQPQPMVQPLDSTLPIERMRNCTTTCNGGFCNTTCM